MGIPSCINPGHDPYIRESPGAVQAVVMIHGICSTPRHFDWLIPEFDSTWSVYNILLDGHGGTVGDFAKTSMQKWKDQIHALLEQLSAKYDRILLVGHSLGTLLAMNAAAQHPKVQGLFLLNPPLRPWVRPLMIRRTLRLIRGKYDETNPHAVACSKDFSIRLTPGILQYFRWAPRFIELLQLCGKCRKICIRVPCYAYLGAQDELVSMRSKRYLEKNTCITLRIFPTAGHYWFSPEDQNTMKRDLLALCSRISTPTENHSLVHEG